jgi:hypothetical protein
MNIFILSVEVSLLISNVSMAALFLSLMLSAGADGRFHHRGQSFYSRRGKQQHHHSPRGEGKPRRKHFLSRICKDRNPVDDH